MKINAISFYRLSHFLYKYRIPVLPYLIKWFIFFYYKADIPYQTQINKKTRLVHGGIGSVINSKAKIGCNVMIAPQVTIGGRGPGSGVPVIGNNVYISTGAKILGGIKIGNNVIIGANAVVIKSVPSNSIVAGIPAKIIKKNINVFKKCKILEINKV